MSFPRLALLLCLVLPLPGLAQGTDSSEVPAPSVIPPPLVPAPPEPQEPSDAPLAREWTPKRAYSPTAPRLVLEILGGALGGALGVIPGGLSIISERCLTNCDDDGAKARAILSLTLGLAGIVGGTTVGIVGAASLVHGEGKYGPTAVGAGAGTLAGILMAIALASSGEESAMILAISGPIIGGIIGYELSHSNADEGSLPSPASGSQILPVISLHPSGGILGGLVGRF